MTEEQNQALIGLCRVEIRRWVAAAEAVPDKKYMADLMQIALAALTAQPVMVSSESFNAGLSILDDVLDDCGDSERGLLLALSRMAIEVEGE